MKFFIRSIVVRHLNVRDGLSSTLNQFAYLWFRRGSVAFSGKITGYRIPGPAPCQEVLIANFGAPNRSDWRVLAVNGDDSTGWTGHYKRAETAWTAHRDVCAALGF